MLGQGKEKPSHGARVILLQGKVALLRRGLVVALEECYFPRLERRLLAVISSLLYVLALRSQQTVLRAVAVAERLVAVDRCLRHSVGDACYELECDAPGERQGYGCRRAPVDSLCEVLKFGKLLKCRICSEEGEYVRGLFVSGAPREGANSTADIMNGVGDVAAP